MTLHLRQFRLRRVRGGEGNMEEDGVVDNEQEGLEEPLRGGSH